MIEKESSFGGEMCAVFCYLSGDDQLHSGFIVRGNDDVYFLVDLQWHYKFSQRALDSGVAYIYATPESWGDANQEIISARLIRLAGKYRNQIPYSIAGHGVKFQKGDWSGVDEGNGLTCSTFVSEFLDSLALPLVNTEGWYSREGDDKWREKIIGYFESEIQKKKMTQEHLNIQLERIARSSVIRIRPADVVVAASKIKKNIPLVLSDFAADSSRLAISIVDYQDNTPCSEILNPLSQDSLNLRVEEVENVISNKDLAAADRPA